MNSLFVEKILATVSVYSVFPPIIAAIWTYKKNDSLQTKLFFYLIFVAGVELYLSWLSHQHINNMPIFHLGTMIEYLFFSYLYYKAIESEIYQKIILTGAALYMIFSTAWLYFFGDIFTFNHETRIFESLLLVFYALCYFNFLSKDLSTKPISFKNIPMFWVSLGVLLYFTGNFFLFLFYKHIVTIFPELWSLHSVLNILTNCLFTVSFLCRTK